MKTARVAMTTAHANQLERMTQAEFDALYSRTARLLHGYLCRLTHDPATADEVLQETYMRMLNSPVMDKLPQKAYLYKTATNLLRDHWRKLKRDQKLWEENEFIGHMHQNITLSLDMAVIFDQMSARERAILWLAHVEELNHKEIGNVLGVKEKSVRVMLFRAREKAKELLEQAGFRGSHE